MVQAGRSGGEEAVEASEFAGRLTSMYASWAEKRRMQCVRLSELPGEGRQSYRTVLAFSGFAAYHILRHEDGLHLMEIPRASGSFRRLSVVVTVVPQRGVPPSDRDALLSAAMKNLSGVKAERRKVVRRYREKPSPLVRDDVRNWRTGRREAVLDGNFDLLHAV